MASDHLGPEVDKKQPDFSRPATAFGLGFAVRIDAGASRRRRASVGEFSWGGVAGTAFWVSPRDALVRDPDGAGARHICEYFRPAVPQLVNAAIL